MSGRKLRGVEFEPKFDKLTLGQFYFNFAEKHSDKIFQIDADLDKSETYGSVKSRSTRLAISLQKQGVDSKDVVCLCSGNSLDAIIPILASFYLGAKVSSLDPSLSVRNTKHLLTLVKPKIIFVEEESLPLIEDCLNDLKLKCEIIVLGTCTKYTSFSDLTKPCSNEHVFKPVQVDVHDTALMYFSSGTTGLPKAICHSHYSFLQSTEITYQCGFTSNTLLHFNTFYWNTTLVLINSIFIDGSIKVFGRKMEGAEDIFKLIEKYKVTSTFILPIFTHKLTQVPNPERFEMSSLTYILTTGTLISSDQYRKLLDIFPKVQILVGYGMTESGLASIFHPQIDKLMIEQKIKSCGKAAPGVVLKIVDPDNEKLLGPHQNGEIRIKSAGLMTGYYGADSTSCFDSEGFLRSGDIGSYDDDDCLYVTGRMRELLKYMRWHIVPSSIEAVLLEHPHIKEAVVFGLPVGVEEEMPAACVVLEENRHLDKDEVENFVAERVSDWERLRGGVVFVESLPKTPSGKLMRKEARNVAMKLMQKIL